MKTSTLEISPELLSQAQAVEQLAAAAFGPGRFARTAFRLREGVPHESALSFVAAKAGELVGAVRVTGIRIGGEPALVLGPLVVAPDHKNEGIGSALMRRAVDAARKHGHQLMILVGDHPYYRPFGFEIVPCGRITLPGPVDPERLLYVELEAGCLSRFAGQATRQMPSA